MKRDHRGKVTFEGWFDKIKYYAIVTILCLIFLAAVAGMFFLKSYRWGNCG